MVKPSITAGLNRIYRHFGGWTRDRPLLLVLILPLLATALAVLAPELSEQAAGLMNVKPIMIPLALFAIAVAAIAMGYLIHFRAHPPKEEPISTDILKDYEHHFRLGRKDIEAIQRDIVEQLFPGVYPKEEEIFRMYEKNPVMGVAIWDPDKGESGQYVAFACAWPIKVRAAEALITGRITENNLTADDILAESQNRRAKYLIVPCIAALDAGTRQGRVWTSELKAAFKDLICDVYFSGGKQSINFIATATSRPGRRICGLYKMRFERDVAIGGKDAPIYVGALTRTDIKR
jgi:hypothetical protein